MTVESERRLARAMRNQRGLVTRAEATRLGLTPDQIAYRVATGKWDRLHQGVYRTASGATTPQQLLLAACLAAGPRAAASHLSAAWIWGLVRRPPGEPVVTVPLDLHPRLNGVTVHRSRDLDAGRVLEHRGIPCTDPLRVLTDVAAELPEQDLISVVDVAIRGRLVDLRGVTEEVRRRSGPGRSGPAALRGMLIQRGMIGGPPPSVLEAEMMQLFKRWGIQVMAREVKYGPEGQYRIDFFTAPGVAVEVDGFTHHWTPEAKARDEARRNELRLGGLFLLVYTWRDVRFDDRRVAREVLQAQRQHAA
ncbi:MAG: type IV toxin-antitoxin system AbiEi family antitoxin domain-containing protein [Acidimicrobiales bacterium]|nr:type IV toxin-antitoxin system AbiEi family antitoxin domain-containing protein [Acidimicrobiales bacterium]